MAFPKPESLVLQEAYDVVIVGSGGASMCAALAAYDAGLSPVILEKREEIGGSTGFSGGVWWVPDNVVMKRAGVADTLERGRAYLDSVVLFEGKGTTRARREAFLTQAPRMIEFLERKGMAFYYADGWSDYYDERPGGEPRGRSVMAKPFDLAALGDWGDKLSQFPPGQFLPLGSNALVEMFMFTRTWKARGILLELVARMIVNALLGRRVVASGGSVQGRMMEMALKRGIPIFTGCAVEDFVVEDGRVTGVTGHRKGARFSVSARRGVLLNSGGFSRNEVMRQKYQRHPTSAGWTNANPGDTGEMIEASMRLGADSENLDGAWWVITSLNPDLSVPQGALGKDGKPYPFMHTSDLACPHLIIVDGAGERYLNEAASYVEIGEAMHDRHASMGRAIPSWAIFDQRHMSRYVWGSVMPGAKPIKAWLASGYLERADSVEALAEQCGIPSEALARTVSRFNAFARSGIDADFAKGARAYDRYRGDPTVGPNPCLGEIAKGPFYAIRLFPSDVGTSGGVVTDEYGRVLRLDGAIIPGLYAAGNCTSSVMGRAYPGAGASIAASFTFGYIAANHMAEPNNVAPGQ